MSTNYSDLIEGIIRREGGYSDHPADRGGPTMYGITEAVARANGYLGPMKDLPKEKAESIYYHRYIQAPGFYKIEPLSAALAEEMIDTGVNMGPAIPTPFLQRLLNLFNQRGTKYADIFVDGKIGPITLDALQKFLAYRGKEGETVLLKAMNSLQTCKYIDFAEAKESQEDFIYGWIRNRT